MEEHLFNTVTLNMTARHVHVSPWYFQRLFQMSVGESTALYIRKRRFSIAAMELLESDKRIIDIAIGLGFSSHESFTRSFKQITGFTPEQYRLRMERSFHYPKLSFAESELFAGISTSKDHEVRVVSLDAMQISGVRLKGLTISKSNSMVSNQKEIEKFWQSIHPMLTNQPEQVGAIIPTGGMKFDYLAGFCTNGECLTLANEGWEFFNIPQQKYAVCSHRGPIEELPQLFKYVIGNWLPKADYEFIKSPELEMYRFDPTSGLAIDIYIPVRKK